MIEIRSYHQDGSVLRVKLRCGCGKSQLQKRIVNDDYKIECLNCHDHTTLYELQCTATVIWQKMEWVLEGVADAARPS